MPREKKPFCIFKRGDRPCFYVKYKDRLGRYLPPITTGQTSELEAQKTAWAWYRDGIPQGEEKVKMATIEAVNILKTAELDKAEVRQIVSVLQRHGVKAVVLAGEKTDRDFIDFLLEFWDFDNSPYVKEKLRRAHGIHRAYTLGQKAKILQRWKPFFTGRLLGTITRQDIDEFIKQFDNSSDISARTKNGIIGAGTIALKWAFQKELIDSDPTQGITYFSGKPAERNILTPEQATAVFAIDWQDNAAKLANLLAALTGMRVGEILALRWQDLGENCLYVRHSWNDLEGLKLTKTNEARTVQMPFPQIMDALKNLAERNPHGQGLSGFVFYSDTRPEQPFDGKILIKKLRAALRIIGMSEVNSKKYTFHGWRHFYTAYMHDRLTAKLLQSQTGHKTLAMLEHYSNHATSGDKERIQQAQISAFAGLLPERISTDKAERERNAHGQYTGWSVAA
ncbi:integrase [Candidatus Termititenax persephonae]|uniref:Integrase n=1 Tax=Candidatus Termititenax persephonae TaxID=2218525 RepID=A0A388TH41_9BACT|nr:integrase [Candidatus Termititenax persephonae]